MSLKFNDPRGLIAVIEADCGCAETTEQVFGHLQSTKMIIKCSSKIT